MIHIWCPNSVTSHHMLTIYSFSSVVFGSHRRADIMIVFQLTFMCVSDSTFTAVKIILFVDHWLVQSCGTKRKGGLLYKSKTRSNSLLFCIIITYTLLTIGNKVHRIKN